MLSIRLRPVLLAIFGLALASGQPLRANYVINFVETGGNVVATGSGTIDLAALFGNINHSSSAYIDPANGYAQFGILTSGSVATYTANYSSKPTNFGTGSMATPNSGSGDVVGVTGQPNNYQLFFTLSTSYVSNSFMSVSDTWNNATFSSLGLKTGTYVWSVGSGADTFSYTINIGTSAVPEPASFVLLGTGSTSLLAFARRRRTTGTADSA